MFTRIVWSIGAVVVAVATLLHLWTHVVGTDTEVSPLHHSACRFHDSRQDPDRDRDSNHHHDPQEHPDGFVISCSERDVAAEPAWYPVTPTACEGPCRARGLALGISCRSPSYGHLARMRATHTLEVCRR
jgi:hypothetical protein